MNKVPINGVEEEHDNFEVFCNDLNVRWVPKYETNRNWIIGGLAGDGKPLFICRGVTDNVLIPGKYYRPIDCCYVALNGKEICLTDFLILARN